MRRRLLLWCGVAGPVLFIVVWLALGATRPAYDPVRTYVSMLSLGDSGWVMKGTFLATGMLFAGFGVGLRTGWPATFIVTLGACVALQGIFDADPGLGYPPGAPDGAPTSGSLHSSLHYLAGLVATIANTAAIVLTARRTSRSGEAGWTIYLALTAAAVVVLFVAIGAASAGGPLQPYAGLIQRLWIVVGFGWIALLALQALRAGQAALRSPQVSPRST